MNRTRFLKGDCQHCSGHIEFPAEYVGTVTTCPHCHQETELLLSPPPEVPTIPRRTLVWTGIAIALLALGFGGALMALKQARKWADRQKRPPTEVVAVAQTQGTAQPSITDTNSSTHDALTASDVTLEKTPGTSLVYAVGTIKNPSKSQRFGVKVELDLADAAGLKVGTASDYRQLIEPGARWEFKALVMDSKAVSATIRSIQEDQ